MRKYGRAADKSQFNVLDLGCGWGNNLKFLADKGFSYSGVDFSKAAVEHCKMSHPSVFHTNLDDLPFKDESFDFAFDRMAIQHNSKEVIKDIFNEVHRVLKPGGTFYSILVSKAEYDYVTSFLSKDEIKDLAQMFSSIGFDYQESSLNNGQTTFRSNILTATKSL
jgi:ubiquinone/menaquinone biosynthesis C-methylase UbiE